MREELMIAVGNVRGRFSDKGHRAARLIAKWDELKTKMELMIFKGRGETPTARLAYATLFMMETGVRIGNEDSAEGYICDLQKTDKEGKVIWQHELYGQLIQTFGLTTLQWKHVTLLSRKIQVEFLGKKAEGQFFETEHPTLVDYTPVHENEENLWLGVSAYELTKFVKRYVGNGYSPKDLRMAKVNDLFIDTFVADHADDFLNATTKKERKTALRLAIEATAAKIGHTAGVCKSAYLSKHLIEYINNELV